MARQIRTLLLFCAAGTLMGCGDNFTVAPFLSGVNAADAPEGQVGSLVLAEGLNMGNVPDSLVFASAGGALPAPTTTWTDNYVIGTVPIGAVGGNVYVETSGGPSQAFPFTVVPQDSFVTGSFGWKAGPALPLGLSGQAVTSADVLQTSGVAHVVYAIGGANAAGVPQDSVFYATVDANGNLSSWTHSTPLPSGIAFAGAMAFTESNSLIQFAPGYLLVYGGTTDDAGTPSSSVWQATLGTSGAISSTKWTQVSQMPAPLHSFGSFFFLGSLYVVGGATTGNQPVATVYRTVIQNTGTPISWITETALPSARSHVGVAQYNGTAYVIGGDIGAATPNDSAGASAVSDILYAPIDPYSRNLTQGWTKAGVALATGRAGLAAISAGAPGAGFAVVTSGLYSGASTASSEENAVALGASGTVSGITVMGASLNAACSCNLFNQGATGYRDGSLHYHVLVVGGDDVNAPGTKHTQTYTY